MTYKSFQNKKTQLYTRNWIFIVILSLIPLIIIADPILCLDNRIVTLKVKENQNIRDISTQYLQDPDLWIDILKSNGLSSPHEVKPGMTLHIPVQDIVDVKQHIDKSIHSIKKATQAGAKIFAPEIIENAIRLRDDAIQKRKSGEMPVSLELAKSSITEAEKALEISKGKQNVPAEAVVQRLQGVVHSRKSSEDTWNNVIRYDVLLEGERIRTMSQSNADILFRDNSMLQLKENAQALIQKMRANLLEDTGEAKVSLIKGDVFALLAGSNKDKRLSIDVQGVETKINSQQFWVGRDTEGTRFANYNGEIEITSAGQKVVLKENQGSVVPLNQKPSVPRDLLPAPKLIAPADGDEKYDRNIVLSWTSVENASYYLLDFARDKSFANIIWSKEIKEVRQQFPDELGTGIFYWRVFAVSGDRLPGRPSEFRFFRFIDENKPPFLVVRSPKDGEIVSDKAIKISGQTENRAVLFIQDQPVKTGVGGEFQFRQDLSDGQNQLIIKAVNQSGKISQIKRDITFIPAGEMFISFDPSIPQTAPKQFLTAQQDFTLSGKTVPNAVVWISSSNGNVSSTTHADAKGQFETTIRITGTGESFHVKANAPAGNKKTEDQFSVKVDNIPPVIHLNEAIVSATAQKTLMLKGSVDDAVELTLNNKPILMENGQFSERIDLSMGVNHLRLVTRDRAENTSIIEKDVLLDQNPPEYIGVEISPHEVKTGETVKLTVKAKDESGLAKAAPYTVRVGDISQTGVLILSDSKESYTGSLQIAAHIKGKVALTSIQLSDYLGNKKKYEF